MPVYEFQCLKCGAIEEYLMSLNDPNPTFCNKCSHDSLVKIPGGSNVGFEFKGSGFYQTDFKGKK